MVARSGPCDERLPSSSSNRAYGHIPRTGGSPWPRRGSTVTPGKLALMREKVKPMRNEFVVERYAHEKHQVHLGEAAHDRLLRTTRTGEQRQIGRTLRAQAARTLAAIAALIAFARERAPWQAAHGAIRRRRAT
jgi:hypothetical protein